jgi:hypothetical protein
MKIVINTDFGGFNLSDEAFSRYLELSGIEYETQVSEYDMVMFYRKGHLGNDEHYLWDGDVPRDNPFLVQVVEEMGGKANGRYAQLKVVEIPDGVEWEIMDYDGIESIHEKHRVWR